jgi:phosphocarrier protein
MYSLTTTVTNPSGLHARPASLFVDEAQKYVSKIFIRNITSNSVAKNAKSIISLLTLAMKAGTEIEISGEGDDEVEAVGNLVKLVESGLGEDG